MQTQYSSNLRLQPSAPGMTSIITRFFIGAAIGVCISTLISAVISSSLGEGVFYFCEPQMIEQFGNEMNAAWVQIIISMILGGGSALASFIWQVDRWSLFRQSLTFFAILFALIIPSAWICFWMPHNLLGLVKFAVIFTVIFALIWVIEYSAVRSSVRKLNSRLGR